VGLFFESFLGGIFGFLTKGHKNMVIGVKVRHHKKRRKKKPKIKSKTKPIELNPGVFQKAQKIFLDIGFLMGYYKGMKRWRRLKMKVEIKKAEGMERER